LSSSSGSNRPAGGPGGAIDERAIDRRLLAALIARHGAPPPPPRTSRDEQERHLLLARRDRALAAVDPAMVRQVARHETSGDRLLERDRRAAGKQTQARDWRIGLDPDRLRVREVGELREIEPPQEIYEAMEHATPQAVLRDLHRPVHMFGEVQLRRQRSPIASASLAQARLAVRELMSQLMRSPVRVERASVAAAAGMAELRAVLARPWEESRPENPLPMPGRAPGMEDMQWFGLSGGYDPDL
jgi:hypothetical protein